MSKPVKILGQIIAYGLFMAFIAAFASSPQYQHLADEQATIKMSFRLTGDLKQPCRQRTPEEIAKMAANMRTQEDCPRERLPISVLLKIDGQPFFEESLQPSGLKKDGVTIVYRRFTVAAGEHSLDMFIRNSARDSGYDYEKSARITLKPAQVFVVEFKKEAGGIVFQ